MKRKYTKKSRKHFRKKSRKYIRKNKMKKTTKKFRKMKGGVGGFPRAQVRARVANVPQHYIYKTTRVADVRLYSYHKKRNDEDNTEFFLKQTEGSNQVMVKGIKNDDGNLIFIHNDTEVPKTEETMELVGIGINGEFRTYQDKEHLDKDDTLIEIRQPGGRLAGNIFIPINVIEYVGSNYG